MNIMPIREIGSGMSAKLLTNYQTIVQLVGVPNVTDMDDPYKVKASWGFMDDIGRKAFIWCYKKADPVECKEWSVDGDMSLLVDLFGVSLILGLHHLYY